MNLKVGQILYTSWGKPVEILRVGRKYFYINSMYKWDNKYLISNLTRYGHPSSQLYLTLREVENKLNAGRYWEALRKHVCHGDYSNPFRLDQLKADCEALDIDIKWESLSENS